MVNLNIYRKPIIILLVAIGALVFSSCTSLSHSYFSTSPSFTFDPNIDLRNPADESVYPDDPQTVLAVYPGGSIPGGNQASSSERIVENGQIVPMGIQRDIVEAGYLLTQTNSLSLKGKTFNDDCTGLVLAAYWGAGLNPVKYFNLYSGGGVERMYAMGEEYNLNYLSNLPNPGDVIIWDNTYDANGDGRWGDPLTHSGIVMSVETNGQISYLHYNYAKGIVIEKMNLKRPNTYADSHGRIVNSPMRMRSDRYIKPEKWLASHLVRTFIPLYNYPGLTGE